MTVDTAPTDAETDVAVRYGMTRLALSRYCDNSWRHVRLSDAVAQARREAGAS